MKEGPLWTRLDERGLLELRGEDVRPLLQGLISNDVGTLTPERAIYAALLTPQGKYLFDFLLYEHDGAILLDAEAARLAELRQRLVMYRLRARATIEDASARHEVAALFGTEALQRLGLPPAPGAARRADDALLVTDPRHPALGARLVAPPGRAAALAEGFGFRAASFEAYDRLRLRLGIPDGSRDLVVQKSTLLESNFEELHGVSFTKGCFVGQELTARMKHRALLKRRLVPVRLDGPPPEPGSPILAGEREVGELRSHRDGLALALLRLDALADATPPLRAGDATVTVLADEPPRRG